MSWRWLAVLSIPFVVAALVVESLSLSVALALIGMLCAGVGVLVPGVTEWKEGRPIDAPAREERARIDRPKDQG